ncbi:hypothetical protein DPMN_070567 [Dreissena polymorpha]|uniref:SGNH hydrolase-type esterase domain-containing protein n=1 Tax=Dreissena polymorpha TaxID=45954 RepID=A0A9D3Z103_DREPO|nr:hypothetical protein DPMN_070567 [Dreissena polymorpha]
MAAPISKKVYIFGHSFVKRLKDFIRQDPSLRYDLGLTGSPMIQYSGFPGATVDCLRNKLQDILDFVPDIVILVVGTNDIYNPNQSPLSVASAIRDFVDTLLFVHGIPRVIVLQTLHRHSPTCHTRYPVDIHWFNNRVDDLNSLLIDWLNSPPHGRAYLWRLKGFWSPECIRTNFADDGCHLSPRGQHIFFHNIRAAVVAALKQSI